MNFYANDEWTLIDELGYENLIIQVLDIIEHASPPFSIGIYGSWGTGKTSIMKQLFFRTGGKMSSIQLPFSDKPDKEVINDSKSRRKFNSLKKENLKDYTAVWFNPWEHQFEDKPIIGLLHAIRENFNLFSKG